MNILNEWRRRLRDWLDPDDLRETVAWQTVTIEAKKEEVYDLQRRNSGLEHNADYRLKTEIDQLRRGLTDPRFESLNTRLGYDDAKDANTVRFHQSVNLNRKLRFALGDLIMVGRRAHEACYPYVRGNPRAREFIDELWGECEHWEREAGIRPDSERQSFVNGE